MKPKTYLEDVTFGFEEDENSLGPHIALTFDFQGGAASGYNNPLLFKSKNETVTPQLISKLKEIGVDTSTLEKDKPTNKSAINPDVYSRLTEILDEMKKAKTPTVVKDDSLTARLIEKMKK